MLHKQKAFILEWRIQEVFRSHFNRFPKIQNLNNEVTNNDISNNSIILVDIDNVNKANSIKSKLKTEFVGHN